MVVEAVSSLNAENLDLSLLGMKKVQGGGLRDSFLVDGVAFKKTFSYAGFEMQKKKYTHPKILALNIELELKSEKDNAEVGPLTFCAFLGRCTLWTGEGLGSWPAWQIVVTKEHDFFASSITGLAKNEGSQSQGNLKTQALIVPLSNLSLA
jgi:hypothetical protein